MHVLAGDVPEALPAIEADADHHFLLVLDVSDLHCP